MFGRGPKDPRAGIIWNKKKELRRLVKRKEYDLALRSGLDLLREVPHENDILFIVGSIYHIRGKHQKAIHYLARSLDVATYDTEALILKASSHLELGQPEEAKECCRMVQEVDPKNREAARILSGT